MLKAPPNEALLLVMLTLSLKMTSESWRTIPDPRLPLMMLEYEWEKGT